MLNCNCRLLDLNPCSLFLEVTVLPSLAHRLFRKKYLLTFLVPFQMVFRNDQPTRGWRSSDGAHEPKRNFPSQRERTESRRFCPEHQGLGPRQAVPYKTLQDQTARQQPRLLYHDTSDLCFSPGSGDRLPERLVQRPLLSTDEALY